MKLPNGLGGVAKLSGKRRNPYRARITKGWIFDPEAQKVKQTFTTIGYYATRKEAIEALIEYSKNPYDIDANSLTFSDVYERWSDVHFEKIVPSAVRTWKSAYSYCKPLYSMRMRDIRVSHLEGVIADAQVGSSTKQRIKSLFNMMYKYALKHEIVDKDYAAMCDSVKRGPAVVEHVPFLPEEVALLWSRLDVPFVDMILIGIYSGWRPQELAILKTSDIDMKEMTMRGGLKTDSGRNRIVPIHPAIVALVQFRLDEAKRLKSDSLFNDEDGQQGHFMTYDKYRRRWEKAMKRLELKHRPHDTRHTFITLAKDANVNEYILKLIVGHAIDDITEKVYTHRTLEDLAREIRKIPNP